MRSLYTLVGLLSLALFANCINARKDPSEYWHGVMKDQPMPQFVQGLVDVGKVTSVSNKKSDCHTSDVPPSFDVKPKYEPSFTKDFEPRPSATAYVDDLKPKDKKSFMRDFEPRPSMTAYVDDLKPKDKKSFMRDFEPRPSATTYTDDVKPEDEKSFTQDFEPRPNVSSYNDDAVGVKAEKAFEKDFEPRPNVSVYEE